MTSSYIKFAAVVLLFGSLASGAEPLPGRILCPGFLVAGKVEFSQVERKLICGSRENPAWADIPENQAIFHTRSFLQAQGYLKPAFTREGAWMVIDPGLPVIASELEAQGVPEEIHPSRLRRIEGRALTPSLLDEIKSRLTGLVASHGYPCPTVDMRGNPDTGAVMAEVKAGPRLKIARVIEEPIEGLDPLWMQRYAAFRLGDWFDAELLTLTTQRILVDGIVQSAFFTITCAPEGAVLHQNFVAGPPRQVTIGFGASTERGPIFRAMWKHGRLGRHGSQVEFTAAASLREQELSTKAKLYQSESPTRHHLRPLLSFRHQDIQPRETWGARLQMAPVFQWENEASSLYALAGPTFIFEATTRGTGPRSAWNIALGGEARWMSHDFELYRASPRSGFDLRWLTNLVVNDVGSPLTANAHRLRFEKYWNVADFLPPLTVVGVRAGVGLTLLSASDAGSPRLTSEYRHYLGGSLDLRGFRPEELPGPERGAMTSVFAGVEVRRDDLLPWQLQPFAFVDGGMTGMRPLTLDDALYWSPGLGLRWQAPIGVFRVTSSHGFIAGTPPAGFTGKTHWQFYLSFGEEF